MDNPGQEGRVAISLLSKLADIPLAFVDVETTGASPELGDRVIEVGIVRVEGGQVVAEYEQLIDPQRPISPGITALTGITPLMCCGKPVFGEILLDLWRLMEGAVVVGHNVTFDLGFLRLEFRRAGDDLTKRLPGALVLDTVRLAQHRFGRGGNGLQKLAKRFGLLPNEPDDHVAHRALADATTTYRVMNLLLEPTGGWQTPLVDVISAQGGPMRLDAPARKSPLPLELEEALGRGGPLEMEYVDQDGVLTKRVVKPVEVRKFRGELILLAWCALRQERRSFKVARISRLAPLDLDSQLDTAHS